MSDFWSAEQASTTDIAAEGTGYNPRAIGDMAGLLNFAAKVYFGLSVAMAIVFVALGFVAVNNTGVASLAFSFVASALGTVIAGYLAYLGIRAVAHILLAVVQIERNTRPAGVQQVADATGADRVAASLPADVG